MLHTSSCAFWGPGQASKGLRSSPKPGFAVMDHPIGAVELSGQAELRRFFPEHQFIPVSSAQVPHSLPLSSRSLHPSSEGLLHAISTHGGLFCPSQILSWESCPLWTIGLPPRPRVMATIVLDPNGFVTCSHAEQPGFCTDWVGTPASASYRTGPSTMLHVLSPCHEHLTQMLCRGSCRLQ